MIEFAGIALLRPAWLIGLPIVAAALYFARRRLASASSWEKAIDAPLLAAMIRLGRFVPASVQRGSGLPALLAVAAALLLVALSGPAIERRSAETFRNLDAIVLVVDVSHATIGTGRLDQALAATRIVAEAAGTRPVGLVIYAGDAYVASNFTTDAAALGTTIAVLDGETVPENGARPERGLALARKMVADAGLVFADIVLVSSGAGIGDAAYTEARRILAAGSRVSALAIPPAAPDARSATRQAALGALASLGGGLVADTVDPMPLADSIVAHRAEQLANSGLSVLVWTDFGRWLVLLALIPCGMMFRRRA